MEFTDQVEFNLHQETLHKPLAVASAGLYLRASRPAFGTRCPRFAV